MKIKVKLTKTVKGKSDERKNIIIQWTDIYCE